MVVADYLIGGVSLNGPVTTAVFAAVLAGLNTFIKPIVSLVTCPIQMMTLGLATLVINALFFMLAGGLVNMVDQGGVTTGNFVEAFIAALIVSVVSTVANWILPG